MEVRGGDAEAVRETSKYNPSSSHVLVCHELPVGSLEESSSLSTQKLNRPVIFKE